MRRTRRAIVLIVVVLLAVSCTLLLREEPQTRPAGRNSVGYGLVLLNEDERVYVLAVSEQSPADLSGLEPGDYITGVNGQAVTSMEALDDMLMGSPQAPALTVIRREQELSLTLSGR